MDVDRVAKDNLRKYGTAYYVNTSGVPLTTLEREAQWESNFQKYELTPEQIAAVTVPYYRRPEDPDHLKLKMSEAVETLDQDEEERLRDDEREEQRTRKSEDYYRQHFLHTVVKLLKENPEWGYKKFRYPSQKVVSLGVHKQKSRTTLVALDTTGNLDPFDLASGKQKIERCGSQREGNPDTLKTSFDPERLLIIMTHTQPNQCNRTKEVVVCERMNSNLWVMMSNVHGRNPWWFSVCPEGSKPKQMIVDYEAVAKMAELENNFNVIVADPPWKIAAKNPTRGVALPYSTMSVKQILQLPWAKLQTEGYLFMWVVTKSYTDVIQHFESLGYIFLEEIVWLKYSKKGKLRKAPGNIFLRCKESCLLFWKGPKSARMATCVGSDVLACLRRVSSQKPDELSELVERMVPGGKYLELFARGYNLRRNWTSIGDQALDGTILTK